MANAPYPHNGGTIGFRQTEAWLWRWSESIVVPGILDSNPVVGTALEVCRINDGQSRVRSDCVVSPSGTP